MRRLCSHLFNFSGVYCGSIWGGVGWGGGARDFLLIYKIEIHYATIIKYNYSHLHSLTGHAGLQLLGVHF